MLDFCWELMVLHPTVYCYRDSSPTAVVSFGWNMLSMTDLWRNVAT